MSYGDTQQFIHYSSNSQGDVAGTVDMEKYLGWLNQHGYGLDMKVQN